MAKTGCSGLWVPGILVLIALLLVTAVLTSSRPTPMRPPARKALCKSNLHSIGLALGLYRCDYGGFPTVSRDGMWEGRSAENLGLLVPQYLDSVEAFDCPSGAPSRAAFIPGSVDEMPFVVNPDYAMDDAIPMEAAASRVVTADIVRDGPPHEDGVNVLFKDTHVGFSTGDAIGTGFANPDLPDADPHVYIIDDGGVDDASLQELSELPPKQGQTGDEN